MRVTYNLSCSVRFRWAEAVAFFAACAAALLFVLTPMGNVHAQGAGDAEKLFEAQCLACHTVGGGVLVGPDLAGVTESRPREWLIEWIVDPVGMVKRGDPTALELLDQYGMQMPGFGLTKNDAEAILRVIETRTASLAGDASSVAAVADSPVLGPPGDFSHGRELFTGSRRFANGGPACMSCHSVAAMGSLGGGAVGPDLTEAVSRYGSGQAIENLLRDIPFPTMAPIFSRRPLTDQERADLTAFLEGAQAPRRSTDSLVLLFVFSILGFAALTVIFQVIWRHRSRGVRINLVGGGRP